MDNTTDLLQIKIEKAKTQLPEETKNAINSVDWKAVILGMRGKKGYSFEQLGDLETETELLLCGLLDPENYPKELENRMKLSKTEVNELVKEMNEQVFAKIKENLIKRTERKEGFTQNTEKEEKSNTQIFNSAGIEVITDLPAVPSAQLMQAGKLELTTPENRENILKSIEKPETIRPISAQKLSGYVKNEVKETEHSLNNITSSNTPSAIPVNPAVDPYREVPE